MEKRRYKSKHPVIEGILLDKFVTVCNPTGKVNAELLEVSKLIRKKWIVPFPRTVVNGRKVGVLVVR